MTPKQQAFVEYYAACGNASDAARRAGYKNARMQGAQNLSKKEIKEAIAVLATETRNVRIASMQERQEFWTDILRGKEGYEAEMKDRLKASELLGKCQGDFIDRVESHGTQEIVVRYVQE